MRKSVAPERVCVCVSICLCLRLSTVSGLSRLSNVREKNRDCGSSTLTESFNRLLESEGAKPLVCVCVFHTFWMVNSYISRHIDDWSVTLWSNISSLITRPLDVSSLEQKNMFNQLVFNNCLWRTSFVFSYHNHITNHHSWTPFVCERVCVWVYVGLHLSKLCVSKASKNRGVIPCQCSSHIEISSVADNDNHQLSSNTPDCNSISSSSFWPMFKWMPKPTLNHQSRHND